MTSDLDAGPAPTVDPAAVDAGTVGIGAADAPGWLLLAALVAAGGMLCFGAVGLLLAINGWYRPAVAFPLGALATVGVVVLARPVWRRSAPAARSAQVYAACGVVAILGITAWNGAHASQHMLVTRDGGAYMNEGRWIARDGSLEVRPRVGPFAHLHGIAFNSYATYNMPNGSLQFQFSHLLPVVLAEAHDVGGDRALFQTPELLGGVALLSFFVLAWRLMRRPLFALSAMLALAFVIPQVSFSRDSYSEIPSQILLFTALWLLVSPRVMPRWRLALCAGLFLGTTEATRIDAIVFLIGVPAIVLVAWLSAGSDERRGRVLPSIGAFLLGIAPGLTLGLVDLQGHSGGYFHDLFPNVRRLGEAAGVMAVAALAVAVSWRYMLPILRRLPWHPIAAGAAIATAAVGFGVWALRPRLQTSHGNADGLIARLQHAEGMTIDATRAYSEHSLDWMRWYLGSLTVAVAIVAAALLVRGLVLGRRTSTVPTLALLGPGSLLYLWRVSATPDHVWADRRYLVSAFPLLILLALGLAACVAGSSGSSRRAVATRVGAVVFAISAFAYPLYTVWPVRSMSEQRGYLAVIKDACHRMGAKPAVMMLASKHFELFDGVVTQALRGWCGADVAMIRGRADSALLLSVAAGWRAQGRQMFVVAADADTVLTALPGVPVTPTIAAVTPTALEQTVQRRPSHYREQPAFQMVIALVPSKR